MQELLEQALAFLLVDSIPLLDSARGLIVLAGDLAQPITGQPAPLFSHAPAQLLPLAFQAIPVHVTSRVRGADKSVRAEMRRTTVSDQAPVFTRASIPATQARDTPQSALSCPGILSQPSFSMKSDLL